MSYEFIFGLVIGNVVGRVWCHMGHGEKFIPAHLDGLWTGALVLAACLLARWLSGADM